MTEQEERALLVGSILMSLETIVEAATKVQTARRLKRRDPVAAALTEHQEMGLASASVNLAHLLDLHQEMRNPKQPRVVPGEVVE
ncbi:hypothetical protein M8C13_04630 [Crossiella sp. SN42]|uniref:hypothetical protein n=1 Tax=Crossiella sp. SN42 TaxID=2944808 RepID=UPI00207CEED7|nr:hypothetical protein [Crossiella sp. SN42]MCO1575045.1 hypothetical protein [Crossiella sp. SN42]